MLVHQRVNLPLGNARADAELQNLVAALQETAWHLTQHQRQRLERQRLAVVESQPPEAPAIGRTWEDHPKFFLMAVGSTWSNDVGEALGYCAGSYTCQSKEWIN